MLWPFSSKCAACGAKVRVAVAAPSTAGLGLNAKICVSCSARLQATASRRATEAKAKPLETEASASGCAKKAATETNGKALFAAIKANDRERILALISSGADVNATRGEGDWDSRGKFLTVEFRGQYSPGDLIAAITTDEIEVPKASSEIKSLNELLRGSSLRPRFPSISLYREEFRSQEALNRRILEAVYPLKCPKVDCWTPLHEAAYYGRSEAIKLLLAAGAKTEERDELGRTPLHYASGRDHIDAVKALIAGGAGINSKTGFGTEWPLGAQTALHNAAENQNVEMVRLLLEAGADKLTEDGQNRATPIRYARKAEVVRLLADDAAVEARISEAKEDLDRMRAALALSLRVSPFLTVVEAMGFRFPNTSDKRRDVMTGPNGRLLVQYVGSSWDSDAQLLNVSFTNGATGERTKLVAEAN